MTLDDDENIILEVSDIELLESEYIGLIDTKYYEVNKLEG